MERFFLLITSLLLLITFYYYSEFENKGYAYILILLCLVSISFSLAKLKYPTEKKDSYQVEEIENDRLENFNGIFEYKSDGFFVNLESGKDFIKWNDILEVSYFDINIIADTYQTGYEIITINKNYEFYDTSTSGIYKLGNMLSENLTNWQINSPFSIITNQALKKRTLYKKK